MEDVMLGRGRKYEGSSDEENDEDGTTDRPDGGSKDVPQHYGNSMALGGAKTGPKGVLQDYKRYKQLQNEEKLLEEQRRLNNMKESSITCKSERQDLEDEMFNGDDDDDDDEFLKLYHQKRLAQLKEESEKYVLGTRPQFTKVHDLTYQDFIEAIDNVDVHVTVIIHIYENSPLCVRMNRCLDCLVKQYPYVKFCRISASEAGLSREFKLNAVPTLQVYKNGILIGNHVRMGDHFDSELYAADLENFLIEHDALPSQEFNAANPVVASPGTGDLSDSDFELD